jgi:ferredoxin
VRIIADTSRCVGSGQCVLTDPAIFDQDDEDGTVVVKVDHPSDGHLDKARQAVHFCPSQALSLDDP